MIRCFSFILPFSSNSKTLSLSLQAAAKKSIMITLKLKSSSILAECEIFSEQWKSFKMFLNNSGLRTFSYNMRVARGYESEIFRIATQRKQKLSKQIQQTSLWSAQSCFSSSCRIENTLFYSHEKKCSFIRRENKLETFFCRCTLQHCESMRNSCSSVEKFKSAQSKNRYKQALKSKHRWI